MEDTTDDLKHILNAVAINIAGEKNMLEKQLTTISKQFIDLNDQLAEIKKILAKDLP